MDNTHIENHPDALASLLIGAYSEFNDRNTGLFPLNFGKFPDASDIEEIITQKSSSKTKKLLEYILVSKNPNKPTIVDFPLQTIFDSFGINTSSTEALDLGYNYICLVEALLDHQAKQDYKNRQNPFFVQIVFHQENRPYGILNKIPPKVSDHIRTDYDPKLSTTMELSYDNAGMKPDFNWINKPDNVIFFMPRTVETVTISRRKFIHRVRGYVQGAALLVYTVIAENLKNPTRPIEAFVGKLKQQNDPTTLSASSNIEQSINSEPRP